jgi:hypothetical protein
MSRFPSHSGGPSRDWWSPAALIIPEAKRSLRPFVIFKCCRFVDFSQGPRDNVTVTTQRLFVSRDCARPFQLQWTSESGIHTPYISGNFLDPLLFKGSRFYSLVVERFLLSNDDDAERFFAHHLRIVRISTGGQNNP